MIYVELFLSFLKIGAFTFGGGYAMISIIRELVLTKGWMTEAELLNFIAVAESTPGPIAVNMATFVGSSQGGILGSLAATLGVVLPAFAIILLISAVLTNFLKYKGVNAFLSGVRPCVVAMILSTGITMGLSVLLSFGRAGDEISADLPGLLIFAVLLAVHTITKKFQKKKPSPMVMILISAILGMILYG